ncbi:MAG: hypothetical protein QW734_01085 [Candidatus Bathyarchaeia archaeon]
MGMKVWLPESLTLSDLEELSELLHENLDTILPFVLLFFYAIYRDNLTISTDVIIKVIVNFIAAVDELMKARKSKADYIEIPI